MRYWFMLVIFFSVLVSPVHAYQIVCPTPERDVYARGPGLKTDVYGKSSARCEYYQNRKRKGVVTGYYYRDSRKDKPCDAPEFEQAQMASAEKQAYILIVGEDPDDKLAQGYWHTIAIQLLNIIEKAALPCEYDGKMIKRLSTSPAGSR